MDKSKHLGISVLICCYNSAARLPETLRHLATQFVPAKINWEIIIINNASTDDTLTVADSEWQQYDMPNVGFKILNQDRLGKNFAFKTGISHAEYDYILTCDDDNWLFPDYIAKAFALMQADETIGALGGCGVFEPQQPFNNQLNGLSGYFVNGPQTWAESQHWVYGAGSIYKKAVIIDLFNKGWQQITSGRTGTSLICGEDVEICLAIYLSGYKIIANNELQFKHFVPLKRQSLSYINNLSYWLSYSSVLLNSYYVFLNGDKRTIREINDSWLSFAVKTYLKSIILLIFQKIIKRKSITIEQKISLNSMLGTCSSLMKNRKKIAAHHQLVARILTSIGSTVT
ncbi:glycosyltransferase family 2 protein [Mucilaginibacter glaciei]|uniref:Glycosyltransferase n=1 Tax=Mucilaginibacter glaciei TaxID=2772109 RepID=A0A926NP10_9SPHI|nr:glycosyltransferase family 2 protein [Mucilaginibacter glaciei]MBD1394701.1 glycosyltransferase [Mucilaginibacter glaciei]